MITKQGILYLGFNSNKSYSSVIHNDSEVAFLQKGEESAFC